MRAMRSQERLVVIIEGALDAQKVRLHQELWSLVIADPSSDVLIDLRDCPLIDGSGVALLVSLMRHTTTGGGSLRLKHAKGQPAELLRQLGISQAIAA